MNVSPSLLGPQPFSRQQRLVLTLVAGLLILILIVTTILTVNTFQFPAAPELARNLMVVLMLAVVVLTGVVILMARTFRQTVGAEFARAYQSLEAQVLERRRAEETLRTQNDYFTTLNDTALGMVGRLNLGELLADILNRAGDLVGTKNGYVFLLNPETNEMEMRVGVGAYQELVGSKAQPNVALAGKVWQTGEAVAVDDYRNWSGRLADPSRNMLRAVVGVPLKSQDKVVGIIGLAHLTADKRFGPNEMDVLNRFASLASIALDNARLYESAERELAERRAVEGKLAYERDLLQAIMDTLPDLVFFKDRESRFVRSNAAHLRNLGATSMDQVFGKTDLDYHVDAPAHSFMDDERHILETGEPILNKVEANPAADGSQRYFETSKVPWRDHDGNIIGTLGVAHNITDRVLAEQKLQTEVADRVSTEQFLDSMIENLPTMLFVKDAEKLRFVRWNKAAETITGHTVQEMLGKNDYDFFPPDEADFFVAKDRETLNGRGVLEIAEEPLASVTGEIRWLHTKKFPVMGADGKPSYLVGISEDITERKQAEAALRESEQRFRSLADHVPSVVYICNNDERFSMIYLNDQVETLTGLRKEEFLENRTSFTDLYHPDDIAGILQTLEQALAEHKPYQLTYRIKHTSNEWRWVEEIGTGVFDPDGKLLFLEGLLFDISERLKAQQELRESEERYRDLFENANDLIQSVRADGHFGYVNRTWKETLGYTEQDLQTMTFMDIIHPDEREHCFELFGRVMQGQNVPSLETAFITKDGRKIYIEGGTTPRIVDGRVVSTRGIFHDVTARRQAEEQASFQNAILGAQYDVSPDGILVVGADDRVLSYNRRFLEMWHVPQDAVATGSTEALRQVVREEVLDVEDWLKRSGEIYMHQDQSSRDEVEFKDGRIFEQYSAPVQTADGGYVGRVWFFHDVTASRRAEEDIRRVTQNARAVFWRANVLKLDDENAESLGFGWQTEYANADTVIKFLPIAVKPGQSFAEAYYASWLDEDKPLMDKRSADALRGGADGYSQEFRLRDVNGNIHWMYEDARVRWLDGTHAEIAGYTIDITDRKQAEETLLRFRRAVEQLTDAVFMTDTQGGIIYVNSAFEKIYGYSAEEAIGKTPRIIKSGMLSAEVYKHFWGTLLNKQAMSGEIVNRNKQGDLIPIEGTNVPILDNNNNIIGFMAVHRDITERKQAEERVRTNEALYESLVETMPQALTRKDREGRVTFGNTRFFEDTGKKPEELYGKTDFDFHPTELAAKYWEDDLRVLRDGATIDTIEPHERGDGSLITVHVIKTPIRDAKGEVNGMQVMFWDITAEQQRQEQIRQQNAYLNALQETSLGLMQRLDVNSLLQDIVARAGALVGTENGYVFLRDPDTDEMVMRVGVGAYEGFVGRRTKPGVGLAGQVWESNAPVVVDDYRTYGARLADPSRDILRGVTGVPMRSGTDVIGVIGLAYLEEGRTFGEAETQVLERFAQLAVIALDNARLYETAQQELAERARAEAELARQLSETELLNRVTNHAVSLDVDTALSQICRDMVEYFGVAQSAIALLSEDKQSLTVVANHSPADQASVVGYVIPVEGNPSTEVVMTTRKPAAFYDAQNDPRLESVHELMKARGTASLLLAPLFVHNDIIGTIGIDSTELREFTPAEMALVERISLSVSTALENARLYRTAQQELAERTRAERETRQRNKELQVISRVSAVMTTNIDMITALETLARELVLTFKARNCGIALLNPDKQSLTVVADALDEGHEEHSVGIRIPVENNPSTQYVLENRRSIVIPDAQTDPMTEPIHERMIQRNTKCLAIIPLMSAGEVIGTIGLDTTDPEHVFSDEEIRLAETMANQMANAIEKQRLFDQAKARARREQLTREIGSNLSRTLDRETILQTMARELSHALGASHAVVRMGANEKKGNGHT